MTDYVSLQDVTKTYRMGEITIKAADGISFDVQKGEFVIVVGPSGAGKTTVLNILGGMDVATSGKVFVDGAEITKYRGKKLIQYRREEIGFVFQFYNLMQNLTALENVELAMQICKYPLDAKKVLEEVGLKERMNTLTMIKAANSFKLFGDEKVKSGMLYGNFDDTEGISYWATSREEVQKSLDEIGIPYMKDDEDEQE